MNDFLLHVEGLCLHRDGRDILHNVSLKIQAGQVHGLLGLNGSGKSSLAYTLIGCAGYTPDAGQIRFAGQDITRLSITERARLGLTLAWQEPARFEGLLVGDYLAAGAPQLTREQLWDTLEAVGLSPLGYLRRSVDRTLSGGERKRIELSLPCTPSSPSWTSQTQVSTR
mgnify:CR=1 FL=1